MRKIINICDHCLEEYEECYPLITVDIKIHIENAGALPTAFQSTTRKLDLCEECYRNFETSIVKALKIK